MLTLRRRFGAAVALAVVGVTTAVAQLPPGLTAQLWLQVPGALVVALRNAGDGSGRLFAVRQPGEIMVFGSSQAGATPSSFLDISERVAAGGERGLLGLVFHPDFANNGFFYVNYTRDVIVSGSTVMTTVIARYRVGKDPNRADPDSEQIVLEFTQDFVNHNGGDLHFGPDGYLYIGTGDGGFPGDSRRRAQNLGTLLGKMLRIDVNRPAAPDQAACGSTARYAIPADNPFARTGNGEEGVFSNDFELVGAVPALRSVGGSAPCPEIWAYGLRNPWRWSFAPDGALLIGDVGQADVEEVSLIPPATAAANLGWPCFEGDRPFRPDDPGCATPAKLIAPIITYSSGTDALGSSVVGGYVYRGAHQPLVGRYFYADVTGSNNSGGRVWIATRNPGGGWDSALWLENFHPSLRISSFGEDETGELYFTDLFSGNIYRVVTP